MCKRRIYNRGVTVQLLSCIASSIYHLHIKSTQKALQLSYPECCRELEVLQHLYGIYRVSRSDSCPTYGSCASSEGQCRGNPRVGSPADTDMQIKNDRFALEMTYKNSREPQFPLRIQNSTICSNYFYTYYYLRCSHLVGPVHPMPSYSRSSHLYFL